MTQNTKLVRGQHSATIDDVLEAVNIFADETHQEFSHVKGEISEINSNITRMVTKDYLDDKMSDLRGDLVVMMRKEDNKLKTLVGVLKEKSVLDSSDVSRIYSMEPFAQ